MTVVYLGLGSNIEDRLLHLTSAIEEIKKQNIQVLRVAPVYETPAVLPSEYAGKGEVSSWNQPFLNTVIEINWGASAKQLFKLIKVIEKQLGRKQSVRWAPRIIDIDILLFGQEVINSVDLTIPHKELTKRNFVLAPLKDLCAFLKIPPRKKTVLSTFRELNNPLPSLMHIMNLTPDSFSDGGLVRLENFSKSLGSLSMECIQMVDLGAESTRPGATPVSEEEEWKRLAPFISEFFSHYSGQILRPRLSVDTRHHQTAERAIEKGVDIINDVSGLSQSMLGVLSQSQVDYVLMHSLSVPACRENTFSKEENPVVEIKEWLRRKIDILQQENISLQRIIFDPGIGFGKTADQSLEIIRSIQQFCSPVRLMVGHSRKSFMHVFAPQMPRDDESAGISVALAEKGVDIIRVHNAPLHARVLRGYRQT